MKKKIESLHHLQEEIDRLKLLSKKQEAGIRDHVRGIREDLKPENILLNTLSSLTGMRINKSEFFKNGLAMGLSLVLQRFIFKTETNVERKIYDWVDTIFDKVKSLLNKVSNRGAVGSEKIEDD